VTPPLVVYTFGTPIALILGRNFIDFRASYSAAWGLALLVWPPAAVLCCGGLPVGGGVLPPGAKGRSVSREKEMLAQALREYPTWGHAYIAREARVEALSRLLLDIEGTLLAYWTDIPQAEIQRLLPLIRETLRDYEPRRDDA
jgi:hypothetical protein